MICSLCKQPTLMTVRKRNNGRLYNCCKNCYKAKNAKTGNAYSVSCIYLQKPREMKPISNVGGREGFTYRGKKLPIIQGDDI